MSTVQQFCLWRGISYQHSEEEQRSGDPSHGRLLSAGAGKGSRKRNARMFSHPEGKI